MAESAETATAATAAAATAAKKKGFWAEKPSVYVKGLPFCATVPEIQNLFFDCGETKSVKQVLDPESGRWTGSVVVRFANKEAQELALSLDKTVWTGTGCDGVRFVTIVKYDAHAAKHKNKKSKDAQSVFIGGLPEKVTEQQVLEIFAPFAAECGAVQSVKLTMTDHSDPAKRVCRGFGHVVFESEAAQAAALKLNGRLRLGGAEGGEGEEGDAADKKLYVRKPSEAKDKGKSKDKGKGKGKGKDKGKGRGKGKEKGKGEGEGAGEGKEKKRDGKRRGERPGGNGGGGEGGAPPPKRRKSQG